jgi:hypothetical protein
MDTQVQRVVEWREQKRKAGYQPLTVWLKAEVKHLIEDLASQRRQDLAEVVSEAIRMYAGQHRSPVVPDYVDAATVRRLVAEYVQALGGGVAQAPVLEAPRKPPATGALSPTLLRGEHGWLIQAVRVAARALPRFTCAQMAKQVNHKHSSVIKTLQYLVEKGEISKKGTVYYWVGGQAPPETVDDYPLCRVPCDPTTPE